MNTDNMSILGLTIDYGPYGWLEGYDPAWTPNTTDAQGRRYAYGNQPQHRAVEPRAPRRSAAAAGLDEKTLEDGLALYAETFNAGWQPRARGEARPDLARAKPTTTSCCAGCSRRSPRPRPT